MGWFSKLFSRSNKMKWGIEQETQNVSRCKMNSTSCNHYKTGKSLDRTHFPTEPEALSARNKLLDSNLLKMLKPCGHTTLRKTLEGYSNLFTRQVRDATEERTRITGRMANFCKAYHYLPKKQQEAISLFDNEDVAYAINRYLTKTMMEKDYAKFDYLDPDELIQELSQFITDNQSSEDAVLYRGITLESYLEKAAILDRLSSMVSGDIIHFRGFTSTSVSHCFAKGFAEGDWRAKPNGIIFEIVNGRGGFIDGQAEEVVIQKGSDFIFLGYSLSNDYGHPESDNPFIHIQLEQRQK